MFLAVGTRITVTGQWVDDRRWGRQFKAASVALADQQGAMQTLLGSGFLKGVKSKMAAEIARAFGEETFARLDQAIDFPDRLRVVKGIGPVNERKLNEHGVTTFAQIAAWKKADIVAAEAYLEFDGRIAREDWVGQAKSRLAR